MSGLTRKATNTSPTTSSDRPNCTTRVVPTRRVSRPPSCEPMMMNTPPGTIHSPFVSADRCLASCRKIGSTKSMPNWPIDNTHAVMRP